MLKINKGELKAILPNNTETAFFDVRISLSNEVELGLLSYSTTSRTGEDSLEGNPPSIKAISPTSGNAEVNKKTWLKDRKLVKKLLKKGPINIEMPKDVRYKPMASPFLSGGARSDAMAKAAGEKAAIEMD